jgi:hypothetical protein
VKASSLQEARLLMRERVQCTEANFGAWPNGDPILAEVSVDEDEMPCYEVDGDPNHSDCDA